MYEEMEALLKMIFEAFYDDKDDECKAFTEKDLIKRKMIAPDELDDFDDLYDDGFIDVCDMSQVIDSPKEPEYILSKEAVEFMKRKNSKSKSTLRIVK